MLLTAQDSQLRAILFQFAIINYLLVYTNLHPLLDSDGYYALMDWWDTPGLRLKASTYLRRKLLKHSQKRSVNDREKRIYSEFAVLSLIYILVTLIQNFFILNIIITFGLKTLLNIPQGDLSWELTLVVLAILIWPLLARLLTAGRDEEELE
jgi:hypothetical protein